MKKQPQFGILLQPLRFTIYSLMVFPSQFFSIISRIMNLPIYNNMPKCSQNLASY